MTARMLPHERIDKFVTRLMQSAEVVAPRRVEVADVFYGPVSSPGEVAWDYGTATEPLKRFLLPQSRTIRNEVPQGRSSFMNRSPFPFT